MFVFSVKDDVEEVKGKERGKKNEWNIKKGLFNMFLEWFSYLYMWYWLSV